MKSIINDIVSSRGLYSKVLHITISQSLEVAMLQTLDIRYPAMSRYGLYRQVKI